jgi:hypothetical protein
VINPGLEVTARGFNHQCRLKSFLDHSNDRLTAEVINQAEAVNAVWPDEDVGTACILASEPVQRSLDPLRFPTFAQQHPTVRAKDAKVEQPAIHRVQLSVYD